MSEHLFDLLNTDEWSNAIPQVEQILRNEIHGENGLIKFCRDHFEDKRQSQLTTLRQEFIKAADVKTLDSQLETFTARLKVINLEVQNEIEFNFYNLIRSNLTHLSILYPNTAEIIKSIEAQNQNSDAVLRTISLINKVVHDSTIQSNKVNAGIAGEEFLEALLLGIGLQKGMHFKRQHKSIAYSNTDFVFPWVEDNDDAEIQIFAAVQFSSNDRMRMVSGELKSGGNKFVIIGNGFSASSKKLDAIGAKIIEGMRRENNRLVCYKPELDRTISSLQQKLAKRQKNGKPYKNSVEQRKKLEYFESTNVISFSDFARILVGRFLI